ncbi:hypothetical protein B7Y94_05520 [Candidatus Saccharibacteria bacterium 32-49-12]|nr:MAG: hypothetical protein B7Y94_05520 [Candidatus Saccharibacteria bacterium 32-49-12]
MAEYKVPQDVEADDKLLGPFTFRQFIYLGITVAAIVLAWFLSRLFIGLAVVPLPIILLFGALALPIRKDQPMEIYLAAIVSFYLKPRRRLWEPDGIESLIQVTEPRTDEVRRTKDLTQADAEQRLRYLASIVDSGGWAIRGVAEQPNSAMNSDVYMEAQAAEDILDANNSVARSIDQLIESRAEKMKSEAREKMLHPQPAVAPTINPAFYQPAPATANTQPSSVYTAYAAPSPTDNPTIEPRVTFDPYPTHIQQTVIQPLGDPAHSTPPPPPKPTPAPPAQSSTSDKGPSPDIINLANNTNLSVETIANEAHRLEKKKSPPSSEEVVISLR